MNGKVVFLFGSVAWAGVVGAVAVDGSWKIVVPARETSGVSAALRVAAEEIRADLETAAGLKLAITEEDDGTMPAICLGAAASSRAGFDLSSLVYHDNVVAEKGGRIYLFGNDRSGRSGRSNQDWRSCVLPTVRAAARFLEKAADVGFVMPGKMGTDVHRVDTVELADGTRDVEKATQIAGSGMGAANRMLYSYANGFYGAGVFHSYGGHSYPAACRPSKYFKDHPEYFAYRGGKRVADEHNPSLCVSNPAVQDLILAELIRRFDEGADIVQLAQQDGSDWCSCDKCRAFFGEDVGEALWRLHRDIAEKALELRPNKTVNILSYGPTCNPPKSFRTFPANVMVEMATYGDRDFAKWRGYEVPRGFGVYIYNWGCYQQPGFGPKQSMAAMAVQARRFVTNNVKYVYRCGYGELYGLEGPAYWIFNRVLADPETDVQTAFENYCRHAYGPAAGAMRNFHLELDVKLRKEFAGREQRLAADGARGIAGLVSERARSPWDIFAYVFTPDTLRRMEECLARAEATPGLDVRQKKRLELVRLEFDYVANLGRIDYLYGAYRLKPCQPFFDALAEEIENRNALLARMFDGKGRMKPLADWPELEVFRNYPKSYFMVNGRNGAVIGSPLGWDVKALREKGVLPGAAKKSAPVLRTATKPSATDFTAGAWAEVAWQELGGIQLDVTPVTGRFKALYDDTALYVAIETGLDAAFEMTPFAHDGKCFQAECLDLMVDPTGTKDVYYHFIWNPVDGSVFDEACGLITDPLHPQFGLADRGWNSFGWKAENSRAGATWRCLFTLPYAEIGASAPKAGERWCFNLGRQELSGSGRHSDWRFALWSPNLETRALNSPDAMGDLRFE